jgi:hypothetical protein
MEPVLRTVPSEREIRDAITTFNEIAPSWAYAKELTRATTYWVFDPVAGTFGPSKFVGYAGLSARAYRSALNGHASGAAFGGGTTKRAIEKVTGKPFKSNADLSMKLGAWADALLGPDALVGVDQTKWRFAKLSEDQSSLATITSRAPRAWAFLAKPDIYRIEDAIRSRNEDTWVTAGREIHQGDRVIIWKARGKDGRRGVIALGEVITEPMDLDDSANPFWVAAPAPRLESRVLVRYIIPNALPLWLDEHRDVLEPLSVSRAHGGTVFKVTPEEWATVSNLAGLASATTAASSSVLGRHYKPVGRVKTPVRCDPFEVDPDKVDRGTQAHANTQDALAAFLRARGVDPRSPRQGEPDFDLAWERNGFVYVAEIKSITDDNEEKQLRLGLGQVLRYRQQLARPGRQVLAILVPERRPADASWESLCAAHGVGLAWPGALDRVLS